MTNISNLGIAVCRYTVPLPIRTQMDLIASGHHKQNAIGVDLLQFHHHYSPTVNMLEDIARHTPQTLLVKELLKRILT